MKEKTFNVDTIHDEKMEVVDMLVHSLDTRGISKPYLRGDDEMKGYIKALNWVMEHFDD